MGAFKAPGSSYRNKERGQQVTEWGFTIPFAGPNSLNLRKPENSKTRKKNGPRSKI